MNTLLALTIMFLGAAPSRDETTWTKCPPGTKLQRAELATFCVDANDKEHGPSTIACPSVPGQRPQRSLFWYNRGVLHGYFVYRSCDAHPEGDEYETEGYYVNGERHGLVTWRDRKGRVHDSCTYVSGKLEGTCTEHVPPNTGYAEAGFVTKRHYRNHCQYKTEHLDAAGRVFRSCEILGCRTEGACTNTFLGPTKTPLLHVLGAAKITAALVACYAYQPVAARTSRLLGDYFTGPFVEVKNVMAQKRQIDGTVLVTARVRTRSFGTVDRGNETEPIWEAWRTKSFRFVPVRGGYKPAQCPWQ